MLLQDEGCLASQYRSFDASGEGCVGGEPIGKGDLFSLGLIGYSDKVCKISTKYRPCPSFVGAS